MSIYWTGYERFGISIFEGVVDRLSQVAAEAELTPAQVALAWLRHRSQPIIPIIGARKIEQLEANLRVADLRLSNSQVNRLDEVSQIERGFPHDFLDKPMVRSFTFGGLRERIIT